MPGGKSVTTHTNRLGDYLWGEGWQDGREISPYIVWIGYGIPKKSPTETEYKVLLELT